ncbi:MAG: hypothetical protein ABF504_11435, partial [Komagataeibacter saccharivorans]|uniref:hypothetical protein n=1 Tax=Komagataeibacter saccharivorans TaxID=265959 RepID=UPI0039E756A5
MIAGPSFLRGGKTGSGVKADRRENINRDAATGAMPVSCHSIATDLRNRARHAPLWRAIPDHPGLSEGPRSMAYATINPFTNEQIRIYPNS